MPSPVPKPPVDGEIVAENLHAVQALYFAWQLEQMRAFEVVERITELYQQGLLPLGSSSATDTVRRYVSTGTRLSERERAHLYARVLGAPGGDPDEAEANREFDELWLRFISGVALYARQSTIDDILVPTAPRNALVRDAARALAVNASAHGTGLEAAARKLSSDVQDMLALLEEPEIVQVFGARDMWGVIDEVATRELGGALNTARHRARAQAGSVVLNWLAAHAEALVDLQPVAIDPPPTPAALLQAVEQWVAVSGVQDSAVEQQSQPIESPTAPPRPIDLPAIVDELLRQMGLATARPKRVVALFHGANRIARMLAACAIAESLDLALARIDLSRVVSKYIGETEKNLDTIFARAEASAAVLLFDEAEALFGKRSEIPDAHDRYANPELDYLLQRIEAHAGIVIVATNHPPRIVDAMLAERWRRLRRRTIRFPLPSR